MGEEDFKSVQDCGCTGLERAANSGLDMIHT